MLISANNLSQSFGGRTLFEGIGCGIFEGDKVGLIGPNGAGKSTLFKILSQSLKPDQGEVVFRRGLTVALLNQDVFMDDSQSWFQHLVDIQSDYAFIYEVIAKLHLNHIPEDRLFQECSGGLQKRIGLAQQILKKPDVLFLDEPTNHLDVPSIIWLEDFLKESNLTYVLITHDRLFLDRTCHKIFDLDKKNPKYFLVTEGNLSVHLEKKEQLLNDQKSTVAKLKNTLTRETEWLRRGAIARQTKQKFRIENAGAIASELESIKSRIKQKALEFDFGEQKSPKKLLEFEQVNFKYNEQVIIENLDLLVSGTTRLGVMGANGSGKSTLLKLMMSQLSPDSGTIKKYPDLKISYFEQTKNTLISDQSLLKNICPQGDFVHFQGTAIYAKSYLERFGFNYDQMDLLVEKLSGGEKSRLRIAQLMLAEAQLLILDEPTNDLDFETLNSLEESLKNFPGGVILVTHDRYFMDRVCQRILYLQKGQQAQTFSDYFQWEDFENRNFILDAKPKNTANESNKKNIKKLSFKELKTLETIEKDIQFLEEKLISLENESQTETVISNPDFVYKIFVEIDATRTKIEDLYSKWQDLETKRAESEGSKKDS